MFCAVTRRCRLFIRKCCFPIGERKVYTWTCLKNKWKCALKRSNMFLSLIVLRKIIYDIYFLQQSEMFHLLKRPKYVLWVNWCLMEIKLKHWRFPLRFIKEKHFYFLTQRLTLVWMAKIEFARCLLAWSRATELSMYSRSSD